MKKALFILSIAIPFATVSLIAIWLYNLYKGIQFNYKIKGFSIKNLLNREIQLNLQYIIKNNSNYSLTAKGVNIIILYKDKLLASVDIANLNIKKEDETSDIVPVLIKLNNDTAEIITLYTSGNPIPLKIKIKASVYKIPVHITTDYIYTKTQA